MAEPAPRPRHSHINTALRRIGFCVLTLALLGACIDLLDWHLRKTATEVSSYTFTGNTITFVGMTNGSIDVSVGPAGRATFVHQLTEGIRTVQVSEHPRGSVLTVQESGGCNTKLSLVLFGSCVSQYQVQAPAGTKVVAQSEDGKVKATITASLHSTQHGIAVKCHDGAVSYARIP